MFSSAVLDPAPRTIRLLAWCIAGSVFTHVLMLTVLPGWTVATETPPQPLTVELREPPPPPEIVPPKPLPMETRPVPREQPKPVPVKPEPVKATPRDDRPVEQPRTAPILTAPPDAPVTAATPVVPEQRPAPPPPEPPRPPPAPVAAAPAPVTPPRSDASYLNNPKPAYPQAARRRGDEGTVLVRVQVTAEGLASRVGLEKSSGHPSLDESALAAVRTWRFEPARQGGKAIEAPYTVPVVFKLD
jgi:protein TonB